VAGAGMANYAGAMQLTVGSVKALTDSLRSLTDIINTAGNAALTGQQKVAGYGDTLKSFFLPALVGSVIRDINSAILGTTETLRLMTVEFDRLNVSLEANAVAAAKIREGEATMAAARARSDVTGGIAARVAGDPKLQTILAGEHSAGDTGAMRRALKEAATLAAEREAGIASQVSAHADAERAAAQAAVDAAQKKFQTAQAAIMPLGDVTSDRRKVEFTKQVYDAESKLKVLRTELNRLGEADVKSQALALDKVQKKGEAAKIESEFKRQTLKALYEEKGLAEQAAGGFGRLRPNERTAVAEAIKRVKAMGADNVSDWEKEKVGGVFPQFMEKEFQKTGMADPAFKEAMAAAGMQAMDAIQKKIDVLKPEVTVNVWMDAKELAKAVVDEMQGRVKSAEVTAREVANATRAEFEMQQKMRATQTGK
jgi:hypothetical protein